jgi:hypothetical protein
MITTLEEEILGFSTTQIHYAFSEKDKVHEYITCMVLIKKRLVD